MSDSKKKKILFGQKQTIDEMPMQFDSDRDVKPHPSVQQKLARQDTPLKKIPFPKVDPHGIPSNFQELLASERYKEVLEKVKNYTRLTTIRQGDFMTLQQMMMRAFQNIIETEREHREQLEQLAIELVKKEMALPEDAFQFDVKIVMPNEIDAEFNKHNAEDNDEVDIDNDDDDAAATMIDASGETTKIKDKLSVDAGGDVHADEDESEEEVPNIGEDDAAIEEKLYSRIRGLNLERAKRRFINAIIQGASKRGHYMYHLVNDRLREITGSDALLNSYGIMMSVNDLLYWMMPEQLMMQMGMGDGDEGIAGSEEIDRNTEPPTIKARGFCFPVILHELVKGIMEVFAVQGLPENPYTAEKVIELEDVLQKEMWDLRLGPAIWARLRNQYPERILTDEDKREIQNYIFTEIVKLPAKEFLLFAREVISGSAKGARLIQELVNEIDDRLKNQSDEDYDYGQSEFRSELDDMGKDVDEDDFNDWLDSMNIRPSDDDDK